MERETSNVTMQQHRKAYNMLLQIQDLLDVPGFDSSELIEESAMEKVKQGIDEITETAYFVLRRYERQYQKENGFWRTAK